MKILRSTVLVLASALALACAAKGLDCKNCLCKKKADGTYECICEGSDSCK